MNPTEGIAKGESPTEDGDAANPAEGAENETAYVGRHLREPKRRSASQGIGEWVGIVLAALVVALLIKTFVAQTFYIPSGSMLHTLEINDRVVVNKLSYKVGSIHHGDIVVFKRPPKLTDHTTNDLIKRVIALPGDTIEARNGVVYLNGNALDEPYLQPGMRTDNLPQQKIKSGEVLVMGDNRINSQDGRVFGPISEDLIEGKAEFRIWPFSRFGTL